MNHLKNFELFNESKVIRRNLPINTTYKLIDSFYTGGIIDNPMSCQNCGKLIANIGVIQNKEGETFDVGMDCAATLSGIKDSFEFDQNMNNFQEATGIRNKVKNSKKKYPDGKLTLKNLCNGEVVIEMSDKLDRPLFRNYVLYPFLKKYLPDLEKLIENKDKCGFLPTHSDNYNFKFDFSKIKPPRSHENDYSFEVDDYNITIKDIQEKAPSGNINDLIGIFISKDNKELYHTSTYMTRDVKSKIIWGLNKLEFDNYKNKTNENWKSLVAGALIGASVLSGTNSFGDNPTSNNVIEMIRRGENYHRLNTNYEQAIEVSRKLKDSPDNLTKTSDFFDKKYDYYVILVNSKDSKTAKEQTIQVLGHGLIHIMQVGGTNNYVGFKRVLKTIPNL